MNETAGGKMAASIRESMESKETGQFEGNSLGGTQGNDEAASFVSRDTDNSEGRS